MSITTKFGDTGNTRLYSGETVNKVSRRIAIVGDIDELVCALGLVYAFIEKYSENLFDYYLKEISWIQKKLFVVGSEIATLQPKLSNLKNRIDEKEVGYIDEKRLQLEEKIQLPKGFIIPGHQGQLSAYLDLARSITRRCERSIVHAFNEGFTDNKNILIWMNRLSDFLYLLARYAEGNNYTLVKES